MWNTDWRKCQGTQKFPKINHNYSLDILSLHFPSCSAVWASHFYLQTSIIKADTRGARTAWYHVRVVTDVRLQCAEGTNWWRISILWSFIFMLASLQQVTWASQEDGDLLTRWLNLKCLGRKPSEGKGRIEMTSAQFSATSGSSDTALLLRVRV